MKEIISRFAPSPTGDLHVGGVRTALINYIITKKAKIKFPNSKFLLRVEDTDKKRSKEEYTQTIIDGLKWLGINWDEEIIYQSNRINRHKEVALNLLKSKKAFKCNCSQEKIRIKKQNNLEKKISIKKLCTDCENNENVQNLDKDYCIRLNVPIDGFVQIRDVIQGEIKVYNKEIDNYILLRQDGSPTYMLSVVVDDYDMNVNTIIRGDDHLNNTFRQLHLYNALNWELPKFAHLPLIHGSDGSKLSKRHGAININEFKKIGYLNKSVINNLILLGWSPKKNNEIIEINEIIEKFEIQNFSKSPSIFDYRKLDYFNNHFLQQNDGYSQFKLFNNFNEKYKKLVQDNEIIVESIFNVYRPKIKKMSEFYDILDVYLDKNFEIEISNINEENRSLLKDFYNTIRLNKLWNEKEIDICIKTFINKQNIKFSNLGKPLRYVLTNKIDGPSLSSIIFLLGKNKTIDRIKRFINI